MTKAQLETMADNELWEISLKRGGKYNRYTGEALAAQRILRERSGSGLGSNPLVRDGTTRRYARNNEYMPYETDNR